MKQTDVRTSIHICIFILITAIVYLPTLPFDFVLDDHAGIEKNELIRSISLILSHPQSIIRQLTLYISYSLGGIQPAAFRIVNILFHFGNVVLLYHLLRKRIQVGTAFIASLLFAVHPLAVESVVWASSVTYPQYSFFVLLSFLLYLTYIDARRLRFLWGSYAAYGMALLTSEKAFVLVPCLIVYEAISGSLKQHWKQLSAFAAITGGLAWYVLAGFQSRVDSFATSAVTGTVEWLNPFQQVPYVLGTYLRLSVWPDRLTVYQFDERGYAYPEMVIYVGLLCAFFGLLVITYRAHRSAFFFLLMFIIASLPALLPYHIIQIGAERYAYLGLIFLIGGFGVLLDRSVQKLARARGVIWLVCAAIICGFTIRSVVRVNDWQSEMTLREAVRNTAPYSARAYNNIGIQHMNEGRYEEALIYFKQSIMLNPSYSHPYHNIGHMLALAKRYEESLKFYQKAYELNPHEWKTRQDMGQVLFLLGRRTEAIPHLRYAIEKGSPNTDNLKRILDRIASYEQ